MRTDPDAMPIGALSKRTGVKVTTIRYYERAGLMPHPPRSEGDRRLYSRQHERRLSFIKHGRELGFEMDDIRALLRLADRPEMSCDEADHIARRHLDDVTAKIERLERQRTELRRMAAECARGTVAHCRVIDTLSDHGLCAAGVH